MVELSLIVLTFISGSPEPIKGCHYCEAAHHAFCLSLGVTHEQIDSLIKNYTADTSDLKEKAALGFTVRLAKDSHSSSEQDFQTLRDFGFDDEEIMQLSPCQA